MLQTSYSGCAMTFRYWKRFKTVTITQSYSAVYSVSFSPSAPYDFATTNSTRVQIYSCKGKAAKKTISRFKDLVYCSSFRPDGKLVVSSLSGPLYT